MRVLNFALLLGFGAAVTATTPVRLDPPRNSTPAEILQLHECIKARFLDTRSFGMRRILPQQFHGIRDFKPENPAEASVISKLEQKGYDVAFYLAGRKILVEPTPLDARRFSVQGPAFMTGWRKEEFPAPESLLADSRRALIAFETGEGYDIGQPGWTGAPRALRAGGDA